MFFVFPHFIDGLQELDPVVDEHQFVDLSLIKDEILEISSDEASLSEVTASLSTPGCSWWIDETRIDSERSSKKSSKKGRLKNKNLKRKAAEISTDTINIEDSD